MSELSQRRRRRRDEGFTLVELLIVIVILGILATVSVFAVRGITENGQDATCATDFRQIQTAQEAHFALNGTYTTEADLVSSGALRSESSLFDTTTNGSGYDVTPADPACTQSATATGLAGGGGGGGGGTPTPPVPGTSVINPIGAYNGVPAVEYGGSGADELLVFGRGEAAADWAAITATGMDVSRRVTFFDIGDVGDVFRLDGVVGRANNTPPTSYAIYVDDDTSPFDGFASFADALAAVLTDPTYDDGPVHQLDADDTQNLAWLFLQYP